MVTFKRGCLRLTYVNYVAYKLSGGQSFFARSETKDIMGYLEVTILNPEDDSAFFTDYQYTKRGGASDIDWDYLPQEHSISLASCTHGGLTHVLPSKV
jgi:ATP-dependent DNA helicase Rep